MPAAGGADGVSGGRDGRREGSAPALDGGRGPKTDRRAARTRSEDGAPYVRTAMRAGLRPSDDEATLTDERVAVVLVALKAVPTRPHGAAWVDCVRSEAFIRAHLAQRCGSPRSASFCAARAWTCRTRRCGVSRSPSLASGARRRRCR